MSKPSANAVIRLRGVRHNNLKNFDLDLPLHRLIVVTGLSGSGKSSLAFDTLYAEGQRRYIETFSPYARQFFDRMDKPQVDRVEGIPPAIAIEQRNAVRTTRSTVGTLTEICDYVKVLWPQVAQLHCRQCARPVRQDSPQDIWQTLTSSSSSILVQTEDENDGRGRFREILVTFDLPLSEKLSLSDSLALIEKQGYQRLLANGRVVRLDEANDPSALCTPHSALTVVQDRLRLAPQNRARFVEACEQAFHFGKGNLAIHELDSSVPHPALLAASKRSAEGRAPRLYSNRLHCADCDVEYREPAPALFSFNHPLGACPTCKGFGRVITIDYDLAIPDRSLSLAQGAVKPWRSGFSAECQDDLKQFCRKHRVPMDVPFAALSPEHQRWVIEGEPGYGLDDTHRWPRAWYGIKGYFKWLESKSYKMHVRVLLSRYRAYATCPDCDGARFQPEALLYLLSVAAPRQSAAPQTGSPPAALYRGAATKLTLADFYALPIRDALSLVEHLTARFSKTRPDEQNSALRTPRSPLEIVLAEIQSRLRYLNEAGLGYLTLDRPTRTLSGGETERVNLTACLGTRLVNTLFVLDEPSVGLHPRDTDRLVRILQQLRDTGNTVVVVEHEASVMRAADQIVDLGPGHGATGGQVVFQGPFGRILKSRNSLTGQYLSGRRRIEIPQRRPVAASTRKQTSNSELRTPNSGPGRGLRAPRAAEHGWLTLRNAAANNLENLTVRFPLGRLVLITGVSGSGKSTLIREVLHPALESNLKSQTSNLKSDPPKASDRIDATGNRDADDSHSALRSPHSAFLSGHERLSRVVLVDQSSLGRTPRSNPAVYIGAFDDIREFFAQSEPARQHGLNASAFSFNSAQGQCERCRGAGFEKIEMQFLSDVFIRCPDCGGRRYRSHILRSKCQVRGIRCQAGLPALRHA